MPCYIQLMTNMEAVRNLTTDQKAVFMLYNVEQDDFEYYARDFNARNNTASQNPERTLPDKDTPLIISNSHKRGRLAKSESESNQYEEPSIKSKGGRPKGKKDSVPRKPRSDKGKKRGPRTNK